MAADGIILKQTRAYEALAHTLGYANWNTLQALLSVTPSSEIVENPVKVVHADKDARAIEPIWVYTAERLAEQAAPRIAIPLDPKEFDKFVGCYQFRFNEFLTITRDGGRFLAGLTYKKGRAELSPESETKFFVKDGPAQLSFTLNSQNYAESVVLHEDGNEVPAKRVDESVAKAFENALQKYVANNKPTPEREVLLRRLIAAYETDTPNVEDMTPAFVEVSKRTWQAMHRTALRLGKLMELQFLHVNEDGWDVYKAIFENGHGTCEVGFLSPDHKLDLVQFKY